MRRLAAALALSLLAACQQADVEQLALCERLIPALEVPGARYQVIAS